MKDDCFRVLYCASTSSHLRNFHLPYMRWLSENGCKVTALTADGQELPYATSHERASFTKKLWSPKNIKSIFQIKKFLGSTKFSLVVTNTTLAGAVVRAAIALMPKAHRPVVLHICHGFLMNAGDGLKRHVYLLPERICARITDVFAVMNRESMEIAKRYRLGKEIVFTHGMGVEAERFHESEPPNGVFRFVYAAEFSKRKNQAALIQAFADEFDNMPDARLVFAGDGILRDDCTRLAENCGVGGNVDFLGYVSNMPKLLLECDAAVSSSRHEGLPFNIMEAMMSGLPIIASDIAGHRDLLTQEHLYCNKEELREKLQKIYTQGKRRVQYENIADYSLASVFHEWTAILEKLVVDAKRKNNRG